MMLMRLNNLETTKKILKILKKFYSTYKFGVI